MLASERGHPLSMAWLQVQFADDAVTLEYRVQALTVIDIPGLGADLNRDRILSGAEASMIWPELKEALEGALILEFDDLTWAPEFTDFAMDDGGNHLLLRTKRDIPATPKSLRITSHHFYDEGNPSHRLHITVQGMGGGELFYLLDRNILTATFPPPPGDAGAGLHYAGRPWAAIVDYGQLGFEHVLEGIDHLAFLLALLFGIASLRALVVTVTAFTIAHSATLAIASLGILNLPRDFVEPIIAISVLLVLWRHLTKGADASMAWVPAFAFGLFHGFGFAGALGEIGLPTGMQGAALVGFNLGVEAGQLAFLLPIALGVGIVTSNIKAEQKQNFRLQAGSIIGAISLHLVGTTLANILPGVNSLLTEWQPIPGAIVASAAVAIYLLRYGGLQMKALLQALRMSLLLAILFAAGKALGAR